LLDWRNQLTSAQQLEVLMQNLCLTPHKIDVFVTVSRDGTRSKQLTPWSRILIISAGQEIHRILSNSNIPYWILSWTRWIQCTSYFL